MRRQICFLLAAVCGLAIGIQVPAEEPAGYLGDFLSDFNFSSDRLVQLAEAIPEDKYGWRPTDEVRTVSEVFMHVAGANFFFATQLGLEQPEGLPENLEKDVTGKSQVIEILKKSQELVREAAGQAEQDLEKQHSLFGREMSTRRVYMVVAGHSHEHLGQAIAYARSSGTVPPWSQSQDG